jgi:glycosyltransferase involved in cell wall biosynthesis
VFTGKADPESYYLSHDIFILPSRREGMSNALMEAMMYGMPVIATDISGNQDLIDDEKGGYLVAPNDADSLLQKIISLLRNPEELTRMGEYNRKKIKELCDMKIIADLYIDCYKQINITI